MATLTVRLPDDKQIRLKALAKRKHIRVNREMEELSTQAIAEFDAETRFRAMAAKGDVAKGLDILDRLDTAFEGSTPRSAGPKAFAADTRSVRGPLERL